MTMKLVRRGALGLLVATAVAAGMVLYGSGPAGAMATGGGAKFGVTPAAIELPAAEVAAFTAAALPSQPRFYRETVRPGARDTSPYQISHVYEVMLRLQRIGLYRGPVNGIYGTPVVNAVKAFQKQQKLPQSGIVEKYTWARLITASTQHSWGWTTLPAVCRSAGFHACYSRYTFELFFVENGSLWNSWLVRGGAQGLQTVTGTYRVYWQDVNHKSHEFNNAPMPYSQFFYGGEAIHGSATMVDPRSGHSHGCINMYIEDAQVLWAMTAGHPLTVTVYGPWR
jgi:hypothetical protein